MQNFSANLISNLHGIDSVYRFNWAHCGCLKDAARMDRWIDGCLRVAGAVWGRFAAVVGEALGRIWLRSLISGFRYGDECRSR